jgi:TonB family protein
MSQEPPKNQNAKAVISKPPTNDSNNKESSLTESKQVVRDFPDEPEPAKFQGGTLDDFRKWVQKNLVYPPEAKKNGVVGQVFVRFTVASNGKVSDVAIINSVDPLLDKEAVRVISQSPDWTPAVKDGKNVDVINAIHVVFSSEEREFVYYFVDKQAQFQGGNLETFREWIENNLIYPPDAKEKGIFGRVTVQFTVNSKGKACDAVILRGVDPSLDKEVLRILQVSPEWTPAENDGKKVAQQFVMPVIFSLERSLLFDKYKSWFTLLILGCSPKFLLPNNSVIGLIRVVTGNLFLFQRENHRYHKQLGYFLPVIFSGSPFR